MADSVIRNRRQAETNIGVKRHKRNPSDSKENVSLSESRWHPFCICWFFLCLSVVIFMEWSRIMEKILPIEKEASIETGTTEPLAGEYIINSVSHFDSNGHLTFKSKTLVNAELHPNKDIRGLPMDLTHWPLGHMGLGVVLSNLSVEEEKKRNDMFEAHSFQEYISNLIPLNRSLPDWRSEWCKDETKVISNDVQMCSIIICFHNEAKSTLLRTLYSIINRTPVHLIREIILVDDFSSKEYDHSFLDDPSHKIFGKVKIRLIRQLKREGLIRSRLTGIQAVSSGIGEKNVLVFLDSHVEVGIGWLLPLLKVISENPKTIACPLVDAIDDLTFYYSFVSRPVYGMMNWKMDFEWFELSDEEDAARPHLWSPYDSPIMAGGIFAIDAAWFEQLGYYDSGMEIWGGENFELSFKAWMCGGQIVNVPCSRVGHIFRSRSPYGVSGNDVHRNNIRVAKVWMDDFQFLYFDRLGGLGQPLDERLRDFGDISSQIALRKKLSCKSFKWFLDTISPNLPYHELLGSGEIRNPISGLCLDKDDHMEFINQPIDLIPCHGLAANQYWWLTKNNYLLRDYLCIGILPQDGATIAIIDCGQIGNDAGWYYDAGLGGLLRYGRTGRCLTAVTSDENGGLKLALSPCQKNNEFQEWIFTKYNKSGITYLDLTL